MPLKKAVVKNVQLEKHRNNNNNNVVNTKLTKGATGTGSTMKMTITSTPTITQRIHHRKVLRLSAGKRSNGHHHQRSLSLSSGKGRPALNRTTVDAAYDNSDDSGLGFDHHMDGGRAVHYVERNVWMDDAPPDFKRRKLDLKVEQEDINDDYCFPESMKMCKENNSLIRSLPCTSIQNITRNPSVGLNPTKSLSRSLIATQRRPLVTGPITLTTQLPNTSRNGKVQLQIVCQPEQQHRARYQTEGSRGAVKDRTGNGFPIVKLVGYNKPTVLQIFIGTDLGRVAPHMFYQACRVSGKNSTPCIEKKLDGTIVIEVELDPAKEMIATCDCVGILKERNVDVEHRFPEQLSPRSKKKSTKCRMIFRTAITGDDGVTETLQISSQPIVCTQPPGIPEICKKSLTTCSVSGGAELFIFGKNFLKDTKVIFEQRSGYDSSDDRNEVIWKEVVVPDKEFLQQAHLVCEVPAYMHQDIQDAVTVRLYVNSSNKSSEPHTFHYTPLTVNNNNNINNNTVSNSASTLLTTGSTVAGNANVAAVATATSVNNGVAVNTSTVQRLEANAPPATAPFLSKIIWQTGTTNTTTTQSVSTPKQELDLGMMPPPTTLLPLVQRRLSASMQLKTELMDENSQGSMDIHRFRTIDDNSMDHHDGSNQEAVTINDPTMFPMMMASKMDSTPDLNGVDLRMKNTLATVSDLVNTQTPSLATLRKFVVTEPTNMPLPTQTVQSVENYLTTLETVMPKNNVKSENEQLILNTMKEANNLLENQLITESQIQNQMLFESQKSANADMLLTQQNLLNANLLQNVASVKSPQQDLLIGNKSPLIGAQSPEFLINHSSSSSSTSEVLSPLLSSALIPNDIIIHSSPQAEMVSPNVLSPEVILNPQVSPSIMCRNSDNLLQVNTICSPVMIQSNEILTPELSNQPLIQAPPVTVESIVLNAAVDYFETQKKINEITGVQTEVTQEQMLNTLLEARNNSVQENFSVVDSSTQVLLQNTVDLLKLSQASNEYLNPVLDSNKIEANVTQPQQQQQQQQAQPETKKNEEGMITPALTNMSESDLISYINPSCFDQGTSPQGQRVDLKRKSDTSNINQINLIP